MSKNNIDIIKENISRIMKEKKMTQSELSEKTGISQPRISAALAPGNSKCFTAEQIVTLASKDVLNCSTDEILLSPEERKSSEVKTFSDVLKMLFEIDEFMDFCIAESRINVSCNINGYETTLGICSDSPIFETVLSEWQQLKETTLQEPLKSKIIKQWQDDTLKLYKNYKKEDITELPFN